MTGDPVAAPTRPFAPALATLAALVLGAAVMTASAVLANNTVRLLMSIGVVAVGVAVFVLGRRPGGFGRPVLRGAGTGLVAYGTHLFAIALTVATDLLRTSGPGLIALVLYGLPAIVALALATTGMRVWTGAAGVLVPSAGALLVGLMTDGRTVVAILMLVLTVVLTAVVVAAPAGAAWGDLAGAAAGTAAAYAYGGGVATIGALVQLRVPTADVVDGYWGLPPDGVLTVCGYGAVLAATVLLMVAAVRRDPATGLLAAAVGISGFPGPGEPFVWVPLVVFAVALVALRVPAVRAALAAVPAVLRERRPSGATAAAACAVVAGGALVVFAWRGLGELDVSWRLTGVLTAVALLVAGALAYFLPGAPGAALAVVALAATALTRPWAHLLLGGPDEPGTGVLGLVELATTVAVGWALVRRHSRPTVWAAAAYLLLSVLPDVLAPLLGLAGDQSPEPTGHAVVLLLPLVLVGLLAGALAWWDRAPARCHAVGAVVLAAALLLPLKVTTATARQDMWVDQRTSPLDALTPTDGWYSASHLGAGGAVTAVILTLVGLALALVMSVARRPATPLAVAGVLLVFTTLPLALNRLVDAGADVEVFASALFVAAGALAVAAVFAERAARHG